MCSTHIIMRYVLLTHPTTVPQNPGMFIGLVIVKGIYALHAFLFIEFCLSAIQVNEIRETTMGDPSYKSVCLLDDRSDYFCDKTYDDSSNEYSTETFCSFFGK